MTTALETPEPDTRSARRGVSGSSDTVQATVVAAQESLIACPSCGRTGPRSAKYCADCGGPLKAEAPPAFEHAGGWKPHEPESARAGSVQGQRPAASKTLAKRFPLLRFFLLFLMVFPAAVGVVVLITAKRDDDVAFAMFLFFVAAVSLVARRWLPGLGGLFVRRREALEGEAHDFRQREEHKKQVWSFRLERHTPTGDPLPPLAVEMRGTRFSGFITEGDQIVLTKVSRSGGRALLASKVFNRTTDTVVTCKG